MPGPPPNPNARRRNARSPFVQLPAEGRSGPAPDWPLPQDLDLLVKLQVAQQVVDELGSRDDLSAAEKRRMNQALEKVVFLSHKVDHIDDAEQALWLELWRSPQAVAWERHRYHREVAQYVRWKVRAEWGDMEAAKEARALSDRLGLTPLALLRLQWQIVEDEVAAQRPGAPAVRKSPRARLKIAE
jgi:hypothetical protein